MQILELNLFSPFVLRPSGIRLPDNVLAWVGGHMAGLGEEAGEGKANIMMGGMVRRTESAIQGSTTMKGKHNGMGQQDGTKEGAKGADKPGIDALNQKLAPADKGANNVDL